MQDHIYKSVEITGASGKSMEDAVERALERSAQTIHNMRWFEVTGVRGHIENGKIDHWQVSVKVGFKLD